ncbi:SNUT3/LISCH7 family protein [Sporobolomyces salmoneus]|uniref:SNUT3/LISCH7 family protein n=1 Tax=Sporobolomyces salmoneus TaxID=183962 RepID=UPI00316B9D1C
MSYRQDRNNYSDRSYDRSGPSRDYRGGPRGGRQQLNYDDLDGDSTGLPPPRNPRGYEDDRGGYRGGGGYDRRGGGGGGYERRRSRSPAGASGSKRDDYSTRDRTRERGSSIIQFLTVRELRRTDSGPLRIDSRRRSPSPSSSRRRTRSPSRSRSPPPRRRHDSRSPPPPRRDRERERGERDHSSPPPPRRDDGRDRERSKSLVTADDAADVEEQDIAALMGFGGFGTTQGKAHEGELSGAQVKRERAHRQYMNRKGGFNRPLDKIK